MQGAISSHLLKRGVDFASKCAKHKSLQFGAVENGPITEQPLKEMLERFQSPFAIITIGLTLLAFVLFTSALEYSIRFVATNLAIVESTEDVGRIALPTSNEPDATIAKTPLLADVEGEQKLGSQEAYLPAKPITSKLRTTFRHLHSLGGIRSRFRGLRFAAFYMMTTGFFSLIFQSLFSWAGPVGFWAGHAIAAVLTCNAHAAWTHATISDAPADKRFFARFIPRASARAFVLPTLRLQLALGFTHATTALSAVFVHRTYVHSLSHHKVAANLFILPVIIAIASGLFLVLPAYIALIRTEASLLPEDMRPIVPFDRTFGGRMVTLEGVSKKCAAFKSLSMRGAYSLFNRETYKRVLKMQAKFVAIVMAVSLSFVTILACEVYMIAGGEEKIREAINAAQAHMH